MHYGTVPNRAPPSDDRVQIIRQMHDGIVLNIAPLPDNYARDVAAQYRAVENAAL